MAILNDWLSIDKTSGEGDATITLTASSSVSLTEKNASIAVKARSKSSVVNIKQNAFKNKFVIFDKLLSCGWLGKSFSTTIVSNVDWTLSVVGDFFTVSQTEGVVGVTSLSVEVGNNITENTQQGKIIFTAINGAEVGYIDIIQTPNTEIEDNIIFYTTIDDVPMTFTHTEDVVGSTFENGVGKVYLKDKTKVPNSLFSMAANEETLKSVSLSEYISVIGKDAFLGQTNLETISCTGIIKDINEYAFLSCDKLVHFPSTEGLTHIGVSAFQGAGLTDFYFPNTLTVINDESFRDTLLTNVSLPNILTSIGEYAFAGTLLTNISLPNTLTTIGIGAFQNTPLENVQMSNSVTTLDEYVFENTNLKSLTIPSNITTLNSNVVNGCLLLDTLIIEDRDTSLTINKKAFGSAPLFNVYVPNLKTWFNVNTEVLTYTLGVKNLFVNNEILKDFSVEDEDVVIPNYAFYNNPHIESVSITPNISSLGLSSFKGLSNCDYLYLNTSKSLSNVLGCLKGNVVVVEECEDSFALQYCHFSEIHYIGKGMAASSYSCSTFKKMFFENDDITVYNSTNTYLSELEEVVINGKNLKIGSRVFYDTVLLTEFDFTNVTSIGEYAFHNSSIRKFTFGKGLTSLGSYAFEYSLLEEITYEDKECSLNTISKYAFRNLERLKVVKLPYPIAQLSDGVFSNTKIDQIEIPHTLQNLGSSCFYNTELKRIDVVDYSTNVESLSSSIDYYAFYGVSKDGFIKHPKKYESVYKEKWLKTKSYYLGYYNWNQFDVNMDTLNFSNATTFNVTITNKTPYEWEITNLPFWVSASAMNGGQGTTDVTFTKIEDYGVPSEITIKIDELDYEITIAATYNLHTLDFTEEDTQVITINNAPSNGFTIEGGVEWLDITQENGNITFTKNISIYDNMDDYIYFTNGEKRYVIRCVASEEEGQISYKADNRIYYTGELPQTLSVIYGTNGIFVGDFYYGGGVRYVEYDRPIIRLNEGFALNANIKRISLPSTLYYIGGKAIHYCENLTHINFGGNELHFDLYGVGINPKLQYYTLPKTILYFGGCSIGGSCTLYDTQGAEVIDIGPNVYYIDGGNFVGFGNTKVVNFWGMTPPEIGFATYTDNTPFKNMNAECVFNAPIGSDYSVVESKCGIVINYCLEAEEPTPYEGPICYDGGQVNLVKPRKTAYYIIRGSNGYDFAYTDEVVNTSDEIVNYTKTFSNGTTTSYGVLGYGVEITKLSLSKSSLSPYIYYLVYGPNINTENVIFCEATYNVYGDSDINSTSGAIKEYNDSIDNIGDLKTQPISYGDSFAFSSLMKKRVIVIDAIDRYGTRVLDSYKTVAGSIPNVWKVDEVKMVKTNSYGTNVEWLKG